ncbi:FkbM family methyltransferase [Lonepinella sp. BR2474]|uniref:FkbM family methyltransferase n=1 Tax=Lonepinella sp. BR2474 TaxID=3434548 RepID=UPI003F6DEDCB
MTTPLNNVYQLKHGFFKLLSCKDLISYTAKRYGEWSEVEVMHFKSLLSPDDNVIEVGSNLGLHAIPIAKAIPNGKLFCFEPQRIIYQHLCCNITLNDLTNVYAYQIGVSDKNELREIESTDYQTAWNYGSFSLNDGFNSEGNFTGKVEKEFLPILTLDSHAEIQKLTSLKLLKIDAEGFELNTILGAKNLIAKHKPVIFVEVHKDIIEQLKTLLESWSYRCFWFATNRYQKNNFFHAPNREEENILDWNFVCYHQASDVPIADFLQPVIDPMLDFVKEIQTM